VKKPFRGNIYNIRVIKVADGKSVKGMTLDGKFIQGDLIPFVKDGKAHEVIVRV